MYKELIELAYLRTKPEIDKILPYVKFEVIWLTFSRVDVCPNSTKRQANGHTFVVLLRISRKVFYSKIGKVSSRFFEMLINDYYDMRLWGM